jgi:hypothetical protein
LIGMLTIVDWFYQQQGWRSLGRYGEVQGGVIVYILAVRSADLRATEKCQ